MFSRKYLRGYVCTQIFPVDSISASETSLTSSSIFKNWCFRFFFLMCASVFTHTLIFVNNLSRNLKKKYVIRISADGTNLKGGVSYISPWYLLSKMEQLQTNFDLEISSWIFHTDNIYSTFVNIRMYISSDMGKRNDLCLLHFCFSNSILFSKYLLPDFNER